VAVGLLAFALLGGSAAAPPPPARSSLRVLQMNLCDSGIAACYSGRAVPEAAAVIRATRPDVVTLDEVCHDDVGELQAALIGARGGSAVFAAFEAAPDRPTGRDTHCRGGQSYGIGLLIAVREPNHGYDTSGRPYAEQDLHDPEIRVWLCGDAIGHFHACVTHLASTSRPVALAQCADLLTREIPAGPTVVGGDFNLRDADMPAGFDQAGDGGVQHVVGAGGFTVVARRTIDMEHTTDHSALLVTLTWPTDGGLM
jgi:hypothetical protein